ncbi:MAG: serine protease [Delftia acidovorans]|nr:serine protease [Delftia acidovorans]
MRPRLPPLLAFFWTLLLAVAAAWLLIWTPAAAADLAERSRALQRAQQAVVGVQAVAVDEARSAGTLGRTRNGSGVVIGADGLVLTIGYLVLEAEDVALVHDDGRLVPARVLGYDVATGFGLLQALAPLRLEPAPLGRSGTLALQTPLMIASGGDDGAVSAAELVARRAFAGYWEYHIEGALFTSPPRRDHSGAGLFNATGELVGIGSLLMNDVGGGDDARGDQERPRRSGNLFVPIDLLTPILAELRGRGYGAASRRAWLGMNCSAQDGRIRVIRVSEDSPADVAGLQQGDRILRIDGIPVDALDKLWKTLWSGGAAEREVTLEIERDDAVQTLKLYSVDRMKTLRRAEGI